MSRKRTWSDFDPSFMLFHLAISFTFLALIKNICSVSFEFEWTIIPFNSEGVIVTKWVPDSSNSVKLRISLVEPTIIRSVSSNWARSFVYLVISPHELYNLFTLVTKKEPPSCTGHHCKNVLFDTHHNYHIRSNIILMN